MHDNSNSMPDLVQKTFKLYKLSFKQLFPLAFVMMFANELFSMVSRDNIVFVDGRVQVHNIPAVAASIVLIIVCTTFFSVMMQVLLSAKARKMHCPYALGVKLTSHVFIRALITSVIFWVAMTAGFMLMVIPAFLLSVVFALFLPVIIFENAGPIKALMRSYALISQQPLTTAGLVLLRWILTYAPPLGVAVFVNLPASSADFGITQVLTIFLNALFAPFIQGLIICQYFTIRKIEEDEKKDKPVEDKKSD